MTLPFHRNHVTFFVSGFPVFAVLLLLLAEAAAEVEVAVVVGVSPGAEEEGGSGGVAVALARRLCSSPALQGEGEEAME